MFINALTIAWHLSLSWVRAMLSIPSKPISLMSVFLILSSHLRLCLWSGLFLSALPTKILHASLFSPHICHKSHLFHYFFDYTQNEWCVASSLLGPNVPLGTLFLCMLIVVLLLVWHTNFHIHTKKEVNLRYSLFQSLRIEIAERKTKNSEFNGIR